MAKRITIPGEAATEAAEAAEAFETYGGKTPPLGTYRNKVVGAKYNESNRNGDPYITVRVNIDHDEDEPKSRFNGYSRTANLTINEAQAKYNKQFCEAVGITAKALHRPVIEDDGTIVKFGATDVVGLRLRVGYRNGSYEGRRTLDPRTYLVDKPDDSDVQDVIEADEGLDEYSDADAPDEYDAETYTGEEEYDEEAEAAEVEGEETEEYAEEGEGEGEEAEPDEYEEETEPVKAPPRKAVKAPPTKAPAKAPAKKAPAKAAARKPF